MTYRLFKFLDEDADTPNVTEVEMLTLDGMSVADRMLEDVVFGIRLSEDRSDLVLSVLNPEDLPPLIDLDATLAHAREVALGSDLLGVDGGGEGMVWDDSRPAIAQVMPFKNEPEMS